GLPGITAKYAATDFWISPIIASLIGYVTVYSACKLHQLYPQQTVIQFGEQIIGKLAGKLIGFLFLFFYIQITGVIVREYAEFLTESFLIETPIKVIMASMIGLCAFAVRGGIEVLGRISTFFSPLFLFPILIFIV